MGKNLNQLNQYLDQFNQIILELKKRGIEGSNNVKLGGSLMFKVHGLNFSRITDDLDIILTNPTEEQKSYLNLIKVFSILKGNYNYENSNYKFTKNGLILNILVINKIYIDGEEENSYETYYKFRNNLYEIVPINEIIKAKKQYDRIKDRNDFLILKKENF